MFGSWVMTEKFPFFFEVAEDLAALPDIGDSELCVLLDYLCDELIILRITLAGVALDLADRWLDLIQKWSQVPHFHMVTRPFDGTTGLVSKNHDHLHATNCSRKLHRTQLLSRLDVSSDSANKDITDTLIEDLFHRHS